MLRTETGEVIDTATPLKCVKSAESLKLANRFSRFSAMPSARAVRSDLSAEWGKTRMRTLLNIAVALAVTTSLAGCYSCRKSYDPCTGLTYRCKEYGSLLFKKKSVCNSDACSTGSHGDGCAECASGGPMMGGHEVYGSPGGWQAVPNQSPTPALPAARPDNGPKKTQATAFHYPVQHQTYKAY